MKSIDIKSLSNEIFELHEKQLNKTTQDLSEKLNDLKDVRGEIAYLHALITTTTQVNLAHTKNYVEELLQKVVDELQSPSSKQ